MSTSSLSVSVIIPSWNRSKFLREAVLSAINQTLPPLEIIVIDNNSDSSDRDSILRLAALHNSVKIVTLDYNHGSGYARNVGIEASRGDWILFLDDDDLLFVDFLMCCFQELKCNKNALIVVGRSFSFIEGRSISYPKDLLTGVDVRNYRKDLISALIVLGIMVGSCLIHREAIGLHRFSAHLRFGEDTVFWLEIFKMKFPYVISENAFVAIRQHPKQTTAIWHQLKTDGASKDSIFPWVPYVLELLEGTESWISRWLCLQVTKNCRSTRKELLIDILKNPAIVLRFMFNWVKKRLIRARLYPISSFAKLNCCYARDALGGVTRATPSIKTQNNRPSILFICGVVPSSLGAGVYQRAYYQLTALAQTYNVHLVLVLKHPEDAKIPASLYGFCHDIEIIKHNKHAGFGYRLWSRWRRLRGDVLAGELASINYVYKTRAWNRSVAFDRIHFFRLSLALLLESSLSRFSTSFISLDMDDLESRSRRSMAFILKKEGKRKQALELLKSSRLYRYFENKLLPSVQKVFVASETDKPILEKRFPNTQFTVLPNVVHAPTKPICPKAAARKYLSLLFVGTLGYVPNMDALRYFASDLAPALNVQGIDWRLRIVGALSQRLRLRLPKGDWRWTWVGWQEELGSEYSIADIVIAPIRCGGGTRIKILEAFAHQVPVVATSVGVEGLDVKHGVHCLITDTPLAFAQACDALKQNPILGETLVNKANELIRSRYTSHVLDTLFRQERAC